MHHKLLDTTSQTEITALFTSVFTATEGENEGELIGELASMLASNIDNHEIICFGTCESGSLVAAIFFTRLRFNEPVSVYMLAPVAVSTAHQGKGVGTALINHGLNELKNRAVAVAVTYGDPAFYSRVGFEPLSETVIQAPLKLSMPHGWLGLSLTGAPIPTLANLPDCVTQFNNPVYW